MFEYVLIFRNQYYPTKMFSNHAAFGTITSVVINIFQFLVYVQRFSFGIYIFWTMLPRNIVQTKLKVTFRLVQSLKKKNLEKGLISTSHEVIVWFIPLSDMGEFPAYTAYSTSISTILFVTIAFWKDTIVITETDITTTISIPNVFALV